MATGTTVEALSAAGALKISPQKGPGTPRKQPETPQNGTIAPSNPSLALFKRISDTLSASLPLGTPVPASRQQEAAPNSAGSVQSDNGADTGTAASSVHGVSICEQGPPLIVDTKQSLLSRGTELAMYFGLPNDETFLDDYNCALRRRILLQGRLYIFDHYVCFSSFVFGFAKKVVIPLEYVTAVRKKTHLRFPNSIKIELGNAPPGNGLHDQYFFTSFLSREDAFQLICNCVIQSRGQIADPDAGHMRTSDLRVDTLEGAASAALGAVDTETETAPGERPPLSARGAASFKVPKDDDDDDDECEEDISEDCMWDVVTSGPVPPSHKDCKVVLRAVLDGTVKELYDLLFADTSHFYEDFLESQGNRRINLGRWTRDAQLGHVRDIQFVSPIKGFSTWGVPNTNCHQSHRFRRFEGNHLVFESSQTMADIPYGDCFTVDLRWDIHPLPDAPVEEVSYSSDGTAVVSVPQVQITAVVRVPFTTMCMFKRVIESGVFKQVKENHGNLITQLSSTLTQMQRDKQPVQVLSPHTLMTRMSQPLQAQPSTHTVQDAAHHAPARDMSRTTSLAGGRPGAHSRSMTPHMVGGVEDAPGHYRESQRLSIGTSFLKLFDWSRYRSFVSAQSGRQSQHESAKTQGMYYEDMDQGSGGGMSAWLMPLLVVLVLIVQLIALAWTLRVWRSVQEEMAVARLAAAGAAGAAEPAQAAFVAMGREMWSRRASLLSSELAQLRDYVRTVEEQLSVAQTYLRDTP